jgi:hypothetical protein
LISNPSFPEARVEMPFIPSGRGVQKERNGCVRSAAKNPPTLGAERPLDFFAARRMSEDAAFLKEQARRCRRLARGIATPDVVETLNRMAADYEARAEAAGAKRAGLS